MIRKIFRKFFRWVLKEDFKRLQETEENIEAIAVEYAIKQNEYDKRISDLSTELAKLIYNGKYKE